MNLQTFAIIILCSAYSVLASQPGRSKRSVYDVLNNLYILNTEPMSWYDAKDWCESKLYGELLKLPTQAGIDELALSILNSPPLMYDDGTPIQYMYIGLNDLVEEGNFRYPDNGIQEPSVTNWGPNQPDNSGGNQHCVVMDVTDMSHWYDMSCDETHAFMCMSGTNLLSWFPFNNRLYKYRRAFLTWHGAAEECKQDGGHLVQVVDGTVNGFLSELSLTGQIDPEVNIWIDANDIASEGSWTFEDGTPLQYTNWLAGEPNNVGDPRENCAVSHPLEQLQWNDIECYKLAAPFCESEYPVVDWTLVNQAMTWTEANAYCESQGKHLVRLKTAVEHIYLLLTLINNGIQEPTWVDGNDAGHDGEYMYTNGWPVHFGAFSAGISRDDADDCLYLDSGASNAILGDRCDTRHPFVCQGGDESFYTTAQPITTPNPTTAESTTMGIETIMGLEATMGNNTTIQKTTLKVTPRPTTILSTVEGDIQPTSGINIIPIVLGVLGGLLAIATITGLVYLVTRKKKKKEENRVLPENGD